MQRILIGMGACMQNAFSGAVFLALREVGLLDTFSEFYMASGSACCLAYIATGQVEEGLKIWNEALPKTKFFCKGKFLTEVFEELFFKKFPLKTEKLKYFNRPIWVALANPKTGQLDYYDLTKSDDPKKLILAAIQMPFFSKPVVYGGQEYFDANLVSSLPFPREIMDGEEVWYILTKPRGWRRSNWRRFLALATLDSRIRKCLYKKPAIENQTLEKLESGLPTRLICPEEKIGGPLDNKKESIDRSFEEGDRVGKGAIENLQK